MAVVETEAKRLIYLGISATGMEKGCCLVDDTPNL